MARVKILKRTTVKINSMLFLLFGLTYLLIIRSLSLGTSALESTSLTALVEDSPIPFILFLPSCLSIYFNWPFSKSLFALFNISILIQSILFSAISLDKLVLILTFTYLVCAVYFAIFLKLEEEEAIYRPSFESNFLGHKAEYKINLELSNTEMKETGSLTNWDENGCFVLLDKKGSLFKGRVDLRVFFEGLEFKTKGKIVTRYDNGHGILLIKEKGKLNWDSFYDIIQDRGYKPRF